MRTAAVAAAVFAAGAFAWPPPQPQPIGWHTSSVGSVVWSTPVWNNPQPTPVTGPGPQPPAPNGPGPQPPTPCMNSQQATQVANNFRNTIASPFSAALIQSAFSPTFHDYSDSVIELINGGCNGPVVLGTPTFNSSAAFSAGQSGQQPIPFNILNLWYTCSSVHIRWAAQPGPGGPASPQQQVTGIIAIETVPNPVWSAVPQQPFLIQTVYSEFNSGAWLYDLGVFVPPVCPAPPPPSGKRSLPMI